MAVVTKPNGNIEYTNKPLALYRNNDILLPMQNADTILYNSNSLYIKNNQNVNTQYIHNSPHVELNATNLKDAVDEINDRVVKGGRYFNQINLSVLTDSDNRLLSTYTPVKIDFYPSAQKYIMLLYNSTSYKSVLCSSDNGILFDTVVGEIVGTLDSMCVIGGKVYFAGCATNYVERYVWNEDTEEYDTEITTKVTSGIFSISSLAQFTSEGSNQFKTEKLIYTYMQQEGRVTPDPSYLVSCNTSMCCDEDSICATIYNANLQTWICVTIKCQYNIGITYIVNQYQLESAFVYPQVISINGGAFVLVSYRATMTATNSYYYLVYCSYNTNSMIKKIAGTKISSNTYILRNCCNDGEFIYGMQGLVSNPTAYNGGLYYRNFSTILNGISMTDAQATYMGDVTQQLIMRIANIYIYRYCANTSSNTISTLYYSTQPLDSNLLQNAKGVSKPVVFYNIDNTVLTTNIMKKGYVVNNIAYVIDSQNRLYYSQIDI